MHHAVSVQEVKDSPKKAIIQTCQCKERKFKKGKNSLTTAVSAKAPLITPSGRAMARAQCRVADSQSCASIDD